MKDLSNENIIHIENNNIQYLQFKRLLQYQNKLKHCYTLKPLDFKPALNYIGRSQFSYPLFNGNIDDFRVYNYTLTPAEIAEIAGILSGVEDLKSVSRQAISIFPVPADKVLNIKFNEKINAGKSEISVLDVSGNIHFSQRLTEYDNVSLDVSDFPSGIYILKLSAGSEIFVKKFVVNH